METERPRVLVAVDFSAASDRAVEEAGRLARQLGAQIDLVHIYPLPPTTAELPPMTGDGAPVAAAHDALLALERRLAADGFAVKSHFGVGTVVFGVLDYIERVKPALVVVGSHGKGAVMRLLVGSVAESLIRRARVPVLVVPAPERVAVVADTAWSCRDCGHILGRGEASGRCAGCGVHPAHWISAPVTSAPIDAGLSAVGDEGRDEVVSYSSTGLFATSPAGTSGGDVNPELRVRY